MFKCAHQRGDEARVRNGIPLIAYGICGLIPHLVKLCCVLPYVDPHDLLLSPPIKKLKEQESLPRRGYCEKEIRAMARSQDRGFLRDPGLIPEQHRPANPRNGSLRRTREPNWQNSQQRTNAIMAVYSIFTRGRRRGRSSGACCGLGLRRGAAWRS